MTYGAWLVVTLTAGVVVRLLTMPSARRLPGIDERAPRALVSEHSSAARTTAAVCETVGGWLRRAAARQPDAHLDRSLGHAVVWSVIVAPLSLRVSGICFFGLYMRAVLGARRRNQLQERAIERGLAQAIDLFVIALRSGHNITTAVDHVGRWVTGDLGRAFEWCSDQVLHGRTVSDALELVPDRVGEQSRPLIAALVANDRYGAPIVSSLAQLAADSRADQRRRAEADARRLPVMLLFPLVACVLPAFLLLTVVPVVIQTVSTFDIFASS